jgi:hypothetical protein
VEVIGDDGDVDGQLMTVVIGAGGDDLHAVDALHLRPWAADPQPSILCPQGHLVDDLMAGRLPDGRVVCVGTTRSDNDTSDDDSSEEEEDGEDHTMA